MNIKLKLTGTDVAKYCGHQLNVVYSSLLYMQAAIPRNGINPG